VVEHHQALGGVPARGQRAHQDHVSRLAVGLGLDQRSRSALGRSELCPAELEPGTTDDVEGLQPQVLEVAAPGIEPLGQGTR
jgi:hypothetical protein